MLRVIDIETTGLDPAKDAIVEIASVDMVKGGGITNDMQTFVKPTKPIPTASSAVHHILDEDVAHAPSLARAVEQFLGADAYVAHNAEFEFSFLKGHGFADLTWVCTYKCALRVWPDLEQHGNQFLRYHLSLANPFGTPRSQITPHCASSDVVVTAAIFERLIAEATWPDLVQWSSEPTRYTRFHFGKHYGKRYDEVPVDYLDWIIGARDMDVAIKESARHWLRVRAS